MGKWYLVRHGQTGYNAEGRIQGHIDTHLGETGSAQIARLAARLAKTPFAAAYASDLLRAQETVRLLMGARATPLTLLPQLREVRHGAWDGLTYEEIQRQWPALFEQFMQRDVEMTAPGGESITDLAVRLRQAEERIRAAHGPEDDVLVVGHSGSLRALALGLLGLPVSNFWKLRILPGSLGVISVVEDTAILERWNDTHHLEGSDES